MKISIRGDNLEYLLEQLRANGVTKKDYKDIEFDMSFENCFYESDEPSMVVVWNKKIV